MTANRSSTQIYRTKSSDPSYEIAWTTFCLSLFFAHIPGKRNFAADFLSRMQTDPKMTLHLKLTDYVPVRETETETETKAADVSLSIIFERMPFSERIQPVVGKQFVTQLMAVGFLTTFQQNHLITTP